MNAYPSWVIQALEQPQHLLPSPRPDGSSLVAKATTPASEEWACLYQHAEQVGYLWRAVASPWLAAVLDGLCARLGGGNDIKSAQIWLEELELPPTKRYCIALARDLLQRVQDLESNDG